MKVKASIAIAWERRTGPSPYKVVYSVTDHFGSGSTFTSFLLLLSSHLMANIVKGAFKKKKFFSAERKSMQSEKAKAARLEMQKLARKAAKAEATAHEETKYFDTSATYAQVDRGGTVVNCCGIAQGVAQSQRIGDRIQPHSLEVRLDAYYAPNTLATDVGHKLRVTVFTWGDSDSVAGTPAIANLFAFAGGIGDYRISCSPFNWQALKQKLVIPLFDKVYQINTAKDLALRLTLPIKKAIAYDPTLTTGQDKIFMILCADDATGAHTPDVQVQYTTRLLYTDV